VDSWGKRIGKNTGTKGEETKGGGTQRTTEAVLKGSGHGEDLEFQRDAVKTKESQRRVIR
jgi:hypothetical protein